MVISQITRGQAPLQVNRNPGWSGASEIIDTLLLQQIAAGCCNLYYGYVESGIGETPIVAS